MLKPNLVIKVKEIKPKLDHNITLAGLLITDADKAILKTERATEGPIKGLFFFRKTIPTGFVYILNGAEFPNAEAVDLLLYLIWYAEQKSWQRTIEIESLNKLAKEVFGVKKLGKTERKLIERLLTIWKFHGYYFPNSFVWHGERVTAQFGVIEDWIIKSQGRGKPSKIKITFNEKFLEICKETDWYRRPNWLEIKKLRKETAKNLYILALEYKPAEKSKEWKIYINNNLKYWYRNAMNSLADPKYLYPKLIIEKRLRPAIDEINGKTNLKMNLQKTKEGNYCIVVKEVIIPGVEKVEIPFDSMPDEEKTTLIAYVGAIAEEKKIKNIWGFLRSMNSRQVKLWLNRAKRHFSKVQEDRKPKQPKEQSKLSLKDKISKVIRAFGLSDEYLICEDNGREYVICLNGITGKKVHELNTNSDFIDILTKLVGKPVRVV